MVVNERIDFTMEQAYAASLQYFNGDELAASTFTSKYALKKPVQDAGYIFKEASPKDMHKRLALAFVEIEKKYSNPTDFIDILNSLDYFNHIVPGGSVMYGAGNPYVKISLSNCVVIASPEDSVSGIMETGKDMGNLFKARCGVGVSIDTLRPDGALVNNSAGTSTGAWSFADYYSNVCRMIGQNGRRGALMITMSVSHPDIEKFVIMKRDLTKVTGANVSVMLTDEFMEAVTNDTDWVLRFPVDVPIEKAKFVKTIRARDLWHLINESAVLSAEPGLIFWDNYQRNLPANYYPEFIAICVNPCSEIALSPYDSCRLTSINLKGFVKNRFKKDAYFDFDSFEKNVRLAMRIMDDIVDLEINSLQNIIDKVDIEDERALWTKLRDAAVRGRRTGLGTHGLADALACLRIKYDSTDAINIVDKIYKIFRDTAYDESVNLAIERGAFPVFDWELEKNCDFIKRLPQELQDRIAKYGRRNISLLTMAPTGSVSIVSQTSSGLEPVFENTYIRRKKVNPSDPDARVDFVDDTGEKFTNFVVYHHNVMEYLNAHPDVMAKWEEIRATINENNQDELSHALSGVLPDYFVTSSQIDPMRRIEIQGIIQKYIDHGISSCLTGDSLIQTDNGLFELDELAVNNTEEHQFKDVDDSISSINIDNKKAAITQVYNNGIADTLIVNCENGYDITGTYDHKLVVLNKNYKQEWKCMRDISVGDIVVGRIGLRLFNDQVSKLSLESLVGKPFVYKKNGASKQINIPKYLTVELARLLGYMCSDGSVTPNGISLCQVTNNVCLDFSKLVEKIFGINTNAQPDTRCADLVNVVANSRELRDFMQWLGITNHNEIAVPLVIRKATLGMVKEFIKGSTLDGYVSPECIGVATTVSYRYAKQLQALLLNIGLNARVCKSHDADIHEFPNKQKYQTKDSYTVHLSLGEAIRFVDMIGFAEDRKNTECINKLKRTSRLKLKGEIPDNGLRLQFRKDILPKLRSTRLYDMFHSLTCKSKQGMSLNRESLQEMVDLGLSVPDYLLDNTYIFRKVTSVKPGGKKQTHDLSVPNGNSYLANGFISHNTINMPKGTTIEQGQALYERAWKEGLKGVTIYVDGSRSGILVKNSGNVLPTTIEEHPAPKRPKELPCEIHRSTIDGQKWLILVGMLDDRPYEIFGGLAENFDDDGDIRRRHTTGKIIKRKCTKVNAKGRFACYDLIIDTGEGNEPIIIEDIAVSFKDGNYAAATRLISLSLRHGVPIQYIAEQLGRDLDSDLFSFYRVMARVLKKYVKDGATSGEVCTECGAKLVFESGCFICKNCGASSKCG